FFDETEVRPHAAATIEQHHDGDRLDLVRENRNVLPLAVVVDLELIAAEIGNQAAGRIGDRGEHGHRAIAGGERRGLLRSRNRDDAGAYERRDADAKHKEFLNQGRTLASLSYRVEGARAF